MSGYSPYSFALLVGALVFFSALALNIAVPALVLSGMALMRRLLLTLDRPVPQGVPA
ncbi:hypothetical protein [Rhizobium sp. CSW-27]|uniref:hypothetical protein n=1 Tax=Rhizobium sp. CSW-27 TaxID=2839985 RepID=UPI001C028DC0|nr:hypothetical protein [Rhizobium sp. CSW-27]MBT9368265.1 hypothetical protein [Rhizobium sp. CSW-27]